ncbi:MAG: hypothetical protein HQL56_11050, partial [Magnetococcales bacterium]|nr:hypothetical protein [Magnetococcales bacterium]
DPVEARHSHRKQEILKRANPRLEKIRVLLRLSHEQHYLSHDAFEYAVRHLLEIGRMLGGWMKQQENGGKENAHL